ncbi:DUF5696 domain-containing protein [Paenibacillus daejeonensis]|uniref:DUF5696 domain-containing protein n=1 Tax=Paenibacillus daejeonensis TaxID=135193 RepID=UPI0003801F8D|nr:DUF5696 domain-containing protein [Paenibacillus daejeonensis]
MRVTKTYLGVALLLTALLLSGCSGGDSEAMQAAAEPEVIAVADGERLEASFSNPQMQGMKGIAESGSLQLYVDEANAGIAVLDRASGEIWRSNPADPYADTLATGTNKDMLSSQVRMSFYNNLGQISTVNSYTDSVLHQQMKYERIPDGLRVSYQFGTNKKTMDDMPMRISKERFEEMVLSKLDNTGQRALRIAYTEDREAPFYNRNDSALQGLQLERALAAFEEAGYTPEDLEQDIADNNLDQPKPTPRMFNLSIEYTLEDESLLVRVPVSDIRFPEAYPINAISVLDFFGAGGTDEEGSMLVPDGSGALIHFNNGKRAYPAYRQAVYGMDNTMNSTQTYSRDEKVRLPVFGIIKEDRAMLGMIEQGAAVASITADISGKVNSFNYAYPSFVVINKDDITLNADGAVRTLPKFQEAPTRSDFAVRYVFLNGEEATYVGMAARYRELLIERGQLAPASEVSEDGDTPFYLQLVGGIPKQKHRLGIPYQALEPLTTFEEAQAIISQLKERQVDQIKLQYAGWFNEGLDHKVPDRIKVDGALGGKQGLQELATFLEEQDVELYPDTALLTAHRTEGFRVSREASRMLSEAPAALYPMNQAINRRDRNRSPAYLVSPRVVPGYVDSLLKGLEPYASNGISLRDLAEQLNSDMRKNNQIDRTEAEAIAVDALTRISSTQDRVMAQGGNAYALPYLTDITYAPLNSSRFKLEDEDIPFYQMVIRGSIDYTGAPYNLSTHTNTNQYVLKSLEFGSHVYFTWIYQPSHKVKETEFDYLYAVNYERWIDTASEMYSEVNEALSKVAGQRLTGHEKLADGVFKSTYENGIYFIVNYNTVPVTAEGRQIEAEGYVTGGER